MPAKELNEEQLRDAARLKAAFDAWQKRRRDAGEDWSQEAAAELLGFGQSALAQYLNGKIPLNGDALRKFCALLGSAPREISPSLTAAEIERAAYWVAQAAGQEGRERQPLRCDTLDALRQRDEVDRLRIENAVRSLLLMEPLRSAANRTGT